MCPGAYVSNQKLKAILSHRNLDIYLPRISLYLKCYFILLLLLLYLLICVCVCGITQSSQNFSQAERVLRGRDTFSVIHFGRETTLVMSRLMSHAEGLFEIFQRKKKYPCRKWSILKGKNYFSETNCFSFYANLIRYGM